MIRKDIENENYDIKIKFVKEGIEVHPRKIDLLNSAVTYKSGLKTLGLDESNKNVKIIKRYIKRTNYLVKYEEFDKAIVRYKEVLDRDPRNYEVWSNLGYVYFIVGALNESYRAYKISLDLNRNKITLSRLTLLFIKSLKQHEYELALKLHNFLFSKRPQEFKYQFLLGVILSELKRSEEAYKMFNELLQISLSKSELKVVLLKITDLLEKKGDYDKIIQLCNNYLKKILEKVDDYKGPGEIQETIKLRTEEAYIKDSGRGRIRIDSKLINTFKSGDTILVMNPKKDLKTAGILFPSLPQDANSGNIRLDKFIRRNIGVEINEFVEICRIEAQIAEKVIFRVLNETAIEFNTKALNKELEGRVLSKGDILSFYAFGNELIEMVVADFSPQAMVVEVGINTLLTIESFSLEKELFSELSYAYNQIGEFEKGIKVAKSAINLDSKYAKPWARLGDIYYKQGKIKEALQHFEKAINLDETYAYPHYGIGLIQFDLKNYQDALKYCEKALELDPEFDKALDLKNKLSLMRS